MSLRKNHAESIAESIRLVLLHDWDPIGVMYDPDWPRDEYDSYVGPIYGHLTRGESAEFIAKYLCFVEEKLMGTASLPESALLPVALKLKALEVGASD